MPLGQIDVKSNIRNYRAIFHDGPDFISDLVDLQNVLFVIDLNIWEHHKDKSLKPISSVDHIILPVDEETKSLNTVQELYDKIIIKSPKKNMAIVAVGGGILQDIVGFAASTLYRGVNWIFVPTTLLAQADSCIGAKTSLNYKNYKNLIGTFYPPSEIHIFPEFLKTQLEVDYFSGIGEIVKLHIMGGQADVNDLAGNFPKLILRDNDALLQTINRSLKIKKSYIEEDEFDQGRRNLLNYGHCFGHAIESSTGFAIPHGQAVVFGILLANIVSLKRGLLSSDIEKHLRENLLIPSIKSELLKINLDSGKIINAMKYDKKRTGSGLALVVLENDYKMQRLTDLSEEEALLALKTFL